MTDIVDRLRGLAAIDNCQTSIEAADEITRLRAEHERLRAALEEIAAAKPQQISDTGFQQGPLSLWQWAQRIARAALEAK